jgi:hypothetical protein
MMYVMVIAQQTAYLTYSFPASVTKDLLNISILNQPLLQHLGIAFAIRRPSPNLILDRLKSAIESLRAPLGKELLNISQRLKVAKPAERHHDHTIHENRVTAELLLQLLPVIAHVRPQQASRLAVGGDGRREVVHIPGGHRVRGSRWWGQAEEEREDDVGGHFGVGDLADGGEADLLAVDGWGAVPFLLEEGDGAGWVGADGGAVDR